MVNRREFLVGATAVAAAVSGAESGKLFLPPDCLTAASADRLPLSWSKERFRLLQGRLAAAGYSAT